jgi:hypothetical protein
MKHNINKNDYLYIIIIIIIIIIIKSFPLTGCGGLYVWYSEDPTLSRQTAHRTP